MRCRRVRDIVEEAKIQTIKANARGFRNFENYRKTRGYPYQMSEGKPCGICGR